MTTLRQVLDLLTAKERRQAFLLVPLVIGMALAEIVGIAAIAPFLSLMSDPTALQENALLAFAYETFRFESPRTFLLAVGIGVVVVLLLSNALLTVGYWTLYRWGSVRNHSISRRLLIRYLQQPYSFFLQHNSASLANNILQEVQQVVMGIVVPGLQVIAKGVAALAIVALLVVIDPVLALLVALLLGGAYAGIFLASRNFLRRIGTDRVQVNQNRYQAANEAMGGIKELQLLGREVEMVRRYSGPSLQFALYQSANRVIAQVPRYGLEAIAFGSVVAIVLVLLSNGNAVTEIVPILGLYAFAGYRLLPSLQQVFSGMSTIRYSSGALDEVHEMIHRVDASREDPDAFTDRSLLTPLKLQDRLTFDDVHFHYAEGPPVLQGIDLTIPARSSVAFVGSTGAGKTTVVDLLLGVLRPTEGVITVDGQPIEGDALTRWQMQVGYVPQSIFLTDDTVARNIALGLPDEQIDFSAVQRAARMAQIDTFIEGQLEHGYETVVGERGVRLSGGQRQRLGIARALYHDPEVLVLDEATSALDGSTERHLFDAISHLAGTKTIVMIAHRLATIEACDQIHLLENGRVVASGTYQELISDHGTFRAFVQGDKKQPDPSVAPG